MNLGNPRIIHCTCIYIYMWFQDIRVLMTLRVAVWMWEFIFHSHWVSTSHFTICGYTPCAIDFSWGFWYSTLPCPFTFSTLPCPFTFSTLPCPPFTFEVAKLLATSMSAVALLVQVRSHILFLSKVIQILYMCQLKVEGGIVMRLHGDWAVERYAVNWEDGGVANCSPCKQESAYLNICLSSHSSRLHVLW